METIPHFLAPSLPHSLHLEARPANTSSSSSLPSSFLSLSWQPSQTKEPSLLIYNVSLPPSPPSLPPSLLLISWRFSLRFLPFEDFPPNPMRGLEVPPLVVWVEGGREGGSRLVGGRAGGREGGVLIDVPTPDFSMPFNVITLTCTLVAFFFGSMMGVVVRKGRRRRRRKGGREGGRKGGEGGLKERVRGWWRRRRRRKGGKGGEAEDSKT